MKKIKIALGFIYNDSIPATMEEIGISIITSVLRDNGYEVLLFSSHEDRMNYRGIDEYKPDIIGLTVYNLTKDIVNRASHRLKKMLPETVICFGGTYATSNSREILEENRMVDVVVKGEGEETFLELVNRINNGEDYSSVKGISFRSGSRIIENGPRALIADLNRLPFAARDILRDNKIQVALISTSRGCKARCSFCATQLFWKKWRGRSIENIVDEIDYIVNQYGVRVFNFIDSSFEDTGNNENNLERITKIAREIIRRSLRVYYFVDLRAEIHRKLNAGIINLLKQSGLCAVCIGIEAGNREDLRLYNKIANVEDNCKTIELFKEYRIGINPGFINFNPYTTIERLKQNIDFLSRCGFSILFISRLAAYKDTKLYQKLKKEKLLLINSEKRYIYIDKTIEKFSCFLFKYVNDLNVKHNRVLSHLHYYNILFPHEIILYRTILEQSGQNSADRVLEKLDKYFDRYNRLLEKFNSEFAHWIKNLLSIIASEWDSHELLSCTDELMSKDNLLAAEKKFNDLKKKILLHITRSGYSSILVNL